MLCTVFQRQWQCDSLSSCEQRVLKRIVSNLYYRSLRDAILHLQYSHVQLVLFKLLNETVKHQVTLHRISNSLLSLLKIFSVFRAVFCYSDF